jgi:hypothetical protein
MSKLTETNQRRVLKAFADSIKSVKNNTQISALQAAVEANDLDQVLRVAGLDRSAFVAFEESVQRAYIEGGVVTASQIGRIPIDDGSVAFRFNVRAPEAEQWIREHSSKRIVEILDDQREAIKTTLDAGIALGSNPRTTALDIVGRINPATRNREGGIIGLTNQQAGFINNARQELINLDSAYFTRALRDKRFDATIKKAIETGKPLTNEQITKAITQMENRALRFRGENIARTESLNALRAGQYQAIAQATEVGDIESQDVVRVWNSSGDERTRIDHSIMDGQEVGLDEPFTAPDGSQLMFAGDDSLGAPAEQVINCRCIVDTKIDFIGRAVKIGGFA